MLAGLAFAASAPAAAGPTLVANGLHISTGAIVDPDGRTWVADHNAGFCRVTSAAADGPGAIEPRSCHGGLLPEAAPGPDAAGQPAYVDPTPEWENGDEVVLVPDGASPSQDVWRFRWNPESGLFDDGEPIVMDKDPDPVGAARPRPVAVSIAPDGNAYVSFQRSATIQRIVNPESPKGYSVELVGVTSDGRGAPALAAVYGAFGPLSPPRILVSTTNGIEELPGLPTDAANPAVTQPSTFTLPLGPEGAPATVGAMTYEITNPSLGQYRLFAGTADATPPLTDPGPDFVVSWPHTGGLWSTVATGFSTVGGLGFTSNDPTQSSELLVLDDPALVIDGVPIGTGRMYRIGRGWARVVSGPRPVTNDAAPQFQVLGDIGDGWSLECQLVGLQPDFTDCGEPVGTTTMMRSFPLKADGTSQLTDGQSYTFMVRAFHVNQTGQRDQTGTPDVRTFKYDPTKPIGTPTIVSPKAGAVVTNNPWIELDGPGDHDGAYVCAYTWAGGSLPKADCDDGRPPAGSDGASLLPVDKDVTLTVRAKDAAGNVGDGVASVTFNTGRLVDPASAATEDTTPLPRKNSSALLADGLHLSTGAIEAPDGSIWIADHNAGFCRIAEPTLDGSGHIDHPQLPNDPGDRTCLGGLLPHALPGADAAGQPAFVDPTPKRPGSGDEVVYVPDGASKSDQIARHQWSPAKHRFVPMAPYTTLTAGRPSAAVTGPDPDGPGGQEPDIYFVYKKDRSIERIKNPATAPESDVIGETADGGGSEQIAAGKDAAGRLVIYAGSALGLTKLSFPSIPAPAGTPRAEPIAAPGLGAAAAIGALAFDDARNELYVGTADAATPLELPNPPSIESRIGTDRVVRYDAADGLVKLDEIGQYTMVGGLGVRPDGRVLVLEDRARILPGAPIGTGRLYQIGLPAAHIASGPSNLDGRTALDPAFTANGHPSFAISDTIRTNSKDVECWLRSAPGAAEPVDLGWRQCGPTFTVNDAKPATPGKQALPDGRYVLTVRSTDRFGGDTDSSNVKRYVPETLRFTVDSVAPGKPAVPTVTNIAGVSSAAPWFQFAPAAGESGEGLQWQCRLNSPTVVSDCREGRTFPLNADGTSQLKDGQNTLSVRLVDRAGNVGPESDPLVWQADAFRSKVTFTAPALAAGREFTRQTAPTVTFTYGAVEDVTGDAEPVEIGCRLDGELWRKCNATTETYPRAGDPPLADGPHVFKVHAKDASGNVSGNVVRKVVIDRTGPSVLFAAPTGQVDVNGEPTTGRSTVVGFRVDAATTSEGETLKAFACTLTREGVAVPLPNGACDGAAELSLPSGKYTLAVTATDDLGNVGPTATRTWTVDATPPVVTFNKALTPADGAIVTSSPQFHFAADESATFACWFDSGQVRTDCTSPARDGSLGPSATAHTFNLVATDRFGNATRTITRRFFIPFPLPRPTGNGGSSSGPGPGPNLGLTVLNVAPRLRAAALARGGLPVTVTTRPGATIVRFRVFRLAGARAARAAATKRKLVATVVKRTPKAGTYRFRLKDRRLRRLKPGRYLLEVRTGPSLSKLGPAVSQRFTVRR